MFIGAEMHERALSVPPSYKLVAVEVALGARRRPYCPHEDHSQWCRPWRGVQPQPPPFSSNRFSPRRPRGLPGLRRGRARSRFGQVQARGTIGAGWYGKSDLWRLLQVAPVEVVSICDLDKHLLAGAVEMAAQRQKSGQQAARLR